MKSIRTGLSRVHTKSAHIRGEVKEKVVGYITAAFGLVAGLAWNDAIKAFIDFLLPRQEDGILAKFIYAGVVSVFVVVITVYLVQLAKKNDEKEEESAHTS